MVQVIKFKGGCAKTYGHLQCNIINSTEKERCNIITKSLRLGKIFSNFFFFMRRKVNVLLNLKTSVKYVNTKEVERKEEVCVSA